MPIHLAGEVGFEPTDTRIKIWGLTAWRLPNINKRRYFFITNRNFLFAGSLFKNGADSGARSHNKALEEPYVANYTIPADYIFIISKIFLKINLFFNGGKARD